MSTNAGHITEEEFTVYENVLAGTYRKNEDASIAEVLFARSPLTQQEADTLLGLVGAERVGHFLYHYLKVASPQQRSMADAYLKLIPVRN